MITVNVYPPNIRSPSEYLSDFQWDDYFKRICPSLMIAYRIKDRKFLIVYKENK